MTDTFHVHDVVGQVHQLSEHKLREHAQCDFSFAIHFSFEPAQAAVPCDLNQFRNKNLGNVPSAILRMRQQSNQTDVPLPTAETLMQRRFADDFLPVQHYQRQIVFEVGMPAPLAKHRAVKN